MKRIFVSGNYIIVDKNGNVTPYPMNSSEYNEYSDHLTLIKHPNINTTEFHFDSIGTWFDEAGAVAFTVNSLKTFLRENTSFNSASGGSGAVPITQVGNTADDFIPGENDGEIAYAYNKVGTRWSLTGGYKPSGWYQWNQSLGEWEPNKKAIAQQFELNQAALDGKVEQTDFNNEVLLRTNADNVLQGNIDQEELDRISGDQSLALDVASEIANRIAGDSSLLAQIQSNDTDIAQLFLDIASEVTNRTNADNALQSQINTNSSDVSTNAANIAQEILDRVSADNNLQSQIAQEITDRQNADTLLDTDIILNTADIATLFSNLSQEVLDRQSGDTNLQSQITSNDSEIAQLIIDLAAEAATRAAVDLSLQDDITDEENARIAGDEGTVTTHSDVSDAGSGEIITAQERVDINASIGVHSDVNLTGVTPEDGWILKLNGSEYVPALKRIISSPSLDINTTTTPLVKFSQSINFQRVGLYSFDFSFAWSYDSTTNDFVANLTVGGNELANIFNGELVRQEPKDSAGNNGDGRGTDQKQVISNKLFFNVTTIGQQDVVLTFRATGGGIEASMWDAQVTIEEEFGVINL